MAFPCQWTTPVALISEYFLAWARLDAIMLQLTFSLASQLATPFPGPHATMQFPVSAPLICKETAKVCRQEQGTFPRNSTFCAVAPCSQCGVDENCCHAAKHFRAAGGSTELCAMHESSCKGVYLRTQHHCFIICYPVTVDYQQTVIGVDTVVTHTTMTGIPGKPAAQCTLRSLNDA